MTDRKWKEVQLSDDSIWDKEEPLEGTYTTVETNKGQKGNSNLYTFKTDKGEIKAWGSTVLDDKMLGVPIGTYVRIEYEGLIKSKRGTEYHSYKVFFDEVTRPVSTKPEKPEAEVTDKDLDKPVDLSEIPF